MLRLRNSVLVFALIFALMMGSGCSAPPEASVENLQKQNDSVQVETDRHPNVIIIIADDLAWSDVSTYGETTVHTPNIDRIANSGAVFSSGYVAAPVCAVSRAALLTGKMPQEYGFTYNIGELSNADDGLPLEQKTIADHLKEEGYKTAAIGKWHLGFSEEYYPMKRGFDQFYGFLSGEALYADLDTPGIVTTPTSRNDKSYEKKASWKTVQGPDATPVDNGDVYLTTDFTNKAVEFVSQQNETDEPFFLYLAYNAPHWPLQVPQEYYDRFPEIEDPARRTYVAMITAMDEGVGRVLDTLEERGLSHDTMIFFLSDNGCPGRFGFCDCSNPLGAGKFTHIEGGVRVPFVMSWPKGMKQAGIVNTPVISTDIVATIMSAIGNDSLANTDSVNLVEAASSNVEIDRTLLFGQAPVFAARRGNWKLWKSYEDDVTQLFDLNNDVAELNNVFPDNEEIGTDLTVAVEEWRDSLPDPLWPNKVTREVSMCRKSTRMVY